MKALKLGFWLHLSLVIITSYIVITYFFEPHDNQCQMTFMMEPPKFKPITIYNSMQESLTTPSSNNNNNDKYNTHDYKLFMYREHGFPLENNLQYDLKDSMPILFVPGNAGSYQQVRSLASTCIRRQFQSVDAFKFIFYTIDFRAQLSGLDGGLIESQIQFVHLAVKKIISMHPIETNGVILVGHSVGGFIAKALLTNPDFDPASIPLLINLASPITRPFVNFDSKMRHLYHSTHDAWSQRQNLSSTLSISISGGPSDRLVPTHLSLDPQYDISLTTSSIDEVWLTTDHVSITWCRELMNKLAQLLSALMDKKKTRLVDGKEQQIAIALNELVTDASNQIDNISMGSISREQPVLNTITIQEFTGLFVAYRSTLIESPLIINMTTNREHGDLFVWLEHIGTIKKNGIYGCDDVVLASSKAHCIGKIDLSPRMRTIPSRRYEPNKKSFIIKDESHLVKYLIMDFTITSRLNGESRKFKTPEPIPFPESISIQTIDDQEMKSLYIPTLFEYLMTIPWSKTSLAHEIVPKPALPMR
uniref:GPI inositol-deacylase n=1 Tax=Aceria tosichella TaxID=561515 RepID=A0A6G1S836_9ACAR